jgi:hypothetical protein
MKKFIFGLALVCSSVNAQEMVINAMPLGDPRGSTCKVVLAEYRPGSVVMYSGKCGWHGLSGVAGYIQSWNHSNHIKIVRGAFDSGRAVSWTKVTYINKVNKTIETYEEDEWITNNRKIHKYDDVEADARQAGLGLNFNKSASLFAFANYIDVLE